MKEFVELLRQITQFSMREEVCSYQMKRTGPALTEVDTL